MSKKPVPSLASVPVAAPASAAATPPPAGAPGGMRESLHVRIPAETVERVREAAYRTRRDKQDIADEALREWLDRNNF